MFLLKHQMSNNPELLTRLLAQTKPAKKGCLEWTGFRRKNGYGMTHVKGLRQSATHRLMYMAAHGPIPHGLVVMHACDNPPCINPRHLSVGTHTENLRQSVAKGRHHEARKTHCHRGHLLDGDNLYVCPEGRRHCKHCDRAKQRIMAGWPEDLAYSVPKKQGWPPKGLKRVVPKPVRKRLSSHCGKGHELVGANRYVTPAGYAQCRKCKQDARDRFEARRSEIDGEGVKSGGG